MSCIYMTALLVFKAGGLNYSIPEIIGRIIGNTFGPVSIYDKQIYSEGKADNMAAILFGKAFPIINFWDKQPTQVVDTEIRQEAYYYEMVDTVAVQTESKPEAADYVEESPAIEETSCCSCEKAEEETQTVSVDEETITESSAEAVETVNTVSWVRNKNYELLPLVYSPEQLTDYNFVHDSFYIIPAHTALTEEMLNPAQLLDTDLSVQNGEQPCVLIYHTHSQEEFADSTGDNMSIVEVGDYLEKILTEEYGYKVLHVTTEFDMKDGVLDRSKAYTYAEAEIAEVLAANPDVDLVIDLHRDGVNENTHLVTEINGKQTAKVMLFNGISYSNNQGHIDYLNNPYISDNLAITYQMYVLGKTYYPDFFRCIYIEAYRYNLHLCRRSMLIEAGAQTNTFQEVLNAMEPLAELIDRELAGEMNQY